jgi:hypothetical protein
MNTLKQIVDFVGIPQGSLASARYQYSEPWTMGLNNVNLLVTRGAKPASMRNIIEILQNLTPITLEAEIVGSLSGEEPFEPKIRVNASGGITWFTTIEFSLLGVPNAPVYSHDVSNSGGDFTPTQLAPGRWYLSVVRSGISNSGFVSLRKQLGTITVSMRQPTPSPPVPPPADSSLPPISVEVEQGQFVVGGSGFRPSVRCFVIVVYPDFSRKVFEDTPNSEGKLNFRVDTSSLCIAGANLTLNFTVNQPDASGRDKFTNTVSKSCPN